MKLEDVIMVVDNRKGMEISYLLNFTDYMKEALRLGEKHAEAMAEAISTLYGTKTEGNGWSTLHFAVDKEIHGSFCTGEAQLRQFLEGYYNDEGWHFDTERCSRDCLAVLRLYNLKPDGQPLFPYLHYEPVGHAFHTGEILCNMNGNDYRVLAVLSPENLLLMGMADGQILVGKGVRLYERYPVGERPDHDSMVEGIEWDHGVYLGNDLTCLDFDILRQEYGEPEKDLDDSDQRKKLRRDFWKHKNVEQKEGLAMRVRAAAKESLEECFGTTVPEVFGLMLDRGLYDKAYQTEGKQNIRAERFR